MLLVESFHHRNSPERWQEISCKHTLPITVWYQRSVDPRAPNIIEKKNPDFKDLCQVSQLRSFAPKLTTLLGNATNCVINVNFGEPSEN